MDSTAQFVSDVNVARFVEKLQIEDDPAKRASLQRLLLKELENLGFDCKQLGNVQRQIAEGRHRIEIQQEAKSSAWSAMEPRLGRSGH
jgi:hypothetical protein